MTRGRATDRLVRMDGGACAWPLLVKILLWLVFIFVPLVNGFVPFFVASVIPYFLAFFMTCTKTSMWGCSKGAKIDVNGTGKDADGKDIKIGDVLTLRYNTNTMKASVWEFKECTLWAKRRNGTWDVAGDFEKTLHL